MNVDAFHVKIVQFVSDNVIPKAMTTCKSCYPVVIGGMALAQCSIKQTKPLLDQMPFQDIDVKFVIESHIDSFDHPMLKEVDESRRKFVNNVVNGCKAMLSELKDLVPSYVNPVILSYNRFVQSPIDSADKTDKRRNVMLIPVNVIYYDTRSNDYVRKTLVDTTILSDYTCPSVYKDLSNAQKVLGNSSIVPYVMRNGIPFATCQCVLMDTMRVIKWHMEELKTSPKTKFLSRMLCKYIAKAIIMYVSTRNVSESEYEKLVKLFDEALLYRYADKIDEDECKALKTKLMRALKLSAKEKEAVSKIKGV